MIRKVLGFRFVGRGGGGGGGGGGAFGLLVITGIMLYNTQYYSLALAPAGLTLLALDECRHSPLGCALGLLGFARHSKPSDLLHGFDFGR
jgi:hypothetical protein